VFTGEYRHTVDEKGRVAVPVRFRAELAGGALVSKWIDGCLAIFPRAAWDALADRAAGLPVTDAGARTFQRFLFGTAFEAELDRQGRLVVPGVLREFAGLNGDAPAVVVGSRDHVELWAPDRWEAYSAQMDAPEVLAQHLQGLGI
jgi:MraZ protein